MDINTIDQAPVEPAACPDRSVLRESCRQFEGLLLGMLLKDSLKISSSQEDAGPGAEIMQEFAGEQLATNLSSQGGIGIADMLYKNITNGRTKL
jgi:Rod binding domain-containing protein